MKLAIVGSRNYNNYKQFKEIIIKTLDKWQVEISDITQIISGGAKGGDSLAEKFAKENKIELIVHKPDWTTFGKAAGILRNTDIINDCTHIIAFPSIIGKGTQDSINKAIKNNKTIEIFWFDKKN